MSLSKLDAKEPQGEVGDYFKEPMNSAEEIYETAFKKFKTTVRAKKFDKMYDVQV